MFLLLFSSPTSASSVPAESFTNFFAQGNKAYEQGNYRDAIANYENAVRTGRASAPLLFNLGDAHFKAGQLGHAIYYFRLAEELAPRDHAIQQNLRFAEKSVAGGGAWLTERWWEFPLRVVTLNELTLLWLPIWWIWLGLLIAGRLRPEWRQKLHRASAACAWLAVIMMCWLAAALYLRFGHPRAIVINDAAIVRYGPIPESQTYFTLPTGAELEILQHRQEWIEIQDAQNRIGWIPRKQVLALPAGI